MDSNKQIRYSHYQVTDKVSFGGLMDSDQCKTLARKIMSLYDSNNDGSVDSFEIGYMLSDCYRAMNKGFNPTPTDVASYTRILDKKGNGRVSFEDIEALCVKYFGGNIGNGGGPGMLISQPLQAPQMYSSTNSYASQNQPKPENLSRIAQERLEVARRIFRLIDTQYNGYLTEDEVPSLLRETYKQMGMNYEPTQEDVDQWIQMTDSDGDGKVTLEDYENLVLKSLKQQGISLN